MRFMLMSYVTEEGWGQLGQKEKDQWMGAYRAYIRAMDEAKVLVEGNRLAQSEQAATVRTVQGKLQVLDGPFVDSKEQLGGYYVIEVQDLDEAIAWASRSPGAIHGVMEVRPLWTLSE